MDNPTHWNRRELIGMGAALFAGQGFPARAADVSAAPAQEAERIAHKQRNAMGMAARLMCAGLFESGRDPGEVLDNDVMPYSVLGRLLYGLQFTVDTKAHELSLSMTAANGQKMQRTARYTPGYGCALLPVPGSAEPAARLPAPISVSDSDLQPWPTLSRPEVSPQINAALDVAFAPVLEGVPGKAARLDTRAVVIVHKGKIIGERYAPGITPQTRLISWSMGKGVAASLLGVYAKRYGLDLNAPAPIAAWHKQPDDPRRAIKVIDILQMASGLDFGIAMDPKEAFSDTDLHTQPYCAAIDSEKLVMSRPLLYAPGTFFQYKNCDPLLVMSMIKQGLAAVGEDVHSWPRRALFDVLGASSLDMHTDTVGIFIPSGMMYATARDYARIGQLYAQRGVWQGKALWPTDWVDRLTKPSPSFAGYGGLVWTNALELFPGVARDAYFLSGYFGQRTIVVPSHDLVVVRLGMSLSATSDGAASGAPAGAAAAFPNHIAQVLRGVIAALPS